MNEQHELYEAARRRIRQRKKLYIHFVLFIIGSIFLLIANKLLQNNETYNWYLGAILLWFIILVLHFVNVFITNPYFGKDWEREQTERLVKKHRLKLEKLKKKIDAEMDTIDEINPTEINKE